MKMKNMSASTQLEASFVRGLEDRMGWKHLLERETFNQKEEVVLKDGKSLMSETLSATIL